MMPLHQLRPQDYAKTDLVGVVVNNKDPKMARRLQVRIAVIHDQVLDADLPWAACGVFSGRGPHPNASRVEIPHIGSHVSIKFQQGDPQNPMYTGGVSSAPTVPALFRTNYPNRNGWLIPLGTHFYVDETTKDLHVLHQGTTVNIDADGNVKVVCPTFLLDCPDTHITGNVVIDGATVIHGGLTGQKDCVFDNVSLVLHKHPTAPPGPISSPLPG